MHGLNEDSVEDMRSTLRLDPQLQRPELVELARSTQFSPLELTRLHEEFTFLRFHTKAYGRAKLRGVRQEHVESVLAREFSTVRFGGERTVARTWFVACVAERLEG